MPDIPPPAEVMRSAPAQAEVPEVTSAADKLTNLPDVTLVGEPKEDKEEVRIYLYGQCNLNEGYMTQRIQRAVSITHGAR